jgi:hypothetical protein
MLAAPVAAVGAVGAGGAGGAGGGGADVGVAGEIGTCPICQTTIAPHENVINCPTCQQSHHRECWDEIGGCAVYGCKSAPQSAKAQDTGPVLSAWGDVKQCPMCGEQIKAIALRCRYCGSNFDTVDPLSAQDLRDRVTRQANVGSIRVAAIVIFIFSVIGVLAPLMLIISLVWVLSSRQKISAAGPAYLVLGYAAAGLSIVYSVMMLVFAFSG